MRGFVTKRWWLTLGLLTGLLSFALLLSCDSTLPALSVATIALLISAASRAWPSR